VYTYSANIQNGKYDDEWRLHSIRFQGYLPNRTSLWQLSDTGSATTLMESATRCAFENKSTPVRLININQLQSIRIKSKFWSVPRSTPPVCKLLGDASGLGARSKSIRNLESPTTEDDDNRPAPSITNSY
jgi:hypothetical protein